MVHLVEEFLQIKFHNPSVSRVEIFLCFTDGLLSIPVDSEAIAVLVKITLAYYAKPLRDALLNNSVDDRGDTQHTLTSICLRNLYFPDGLRAVLPPDKIRRQGLPIRVKVVTK